nr:flagellar basal body rod protein FlgC [Kofleriaceae bacterium]
MDFFTAMEVSASGLSAERTRMNVAASNLANAQTTQTAGGGPYQRKNVVLSAVEVKGTEHTEFANAVKGVAVSQIASDTSAPRMEYDPGHPQANAQGYVAYPNVNPVEEMVDMITASRAYEAGVTAMSTAVNMAQSALGIGK